jgi:hypothetical protein
MRRQLSQRGAHEVVGVLRRVSLFFGRPAGFRLRLELRFWLASFLLALFLHISQDGRPRLSYDRVAAVAE